MLTAAENDPTFGLFACSVFGILRAWAKGGGPRNTGRSAEGVDANASKTHLLDVARRLDVRGRSTMSKSELVDAIKKENRRRRGR